MNPRNIATSFVIAAFFGFFFLYSLQLTGSAAYWPKLICVLGGSISLLSALRAGIGIRKDKDGTGLFPLSSIQSGKSLLLIAILILWLFFMKRLGYLASSILATIAVILAFEPIKDRKHIILDISISLVFSTAMYLVFILLGVQFPAGFLR